jgi:hypothetical protein
MGRDSGYRKGSTDMRDAIMCVLERTAGERPQYCPKPQNPKTPITLYLNFYWLKIDDLVG